MHGKWSSMWEGSYGLPKALISRKSHKREKKAEERADSRIQNLRKQYQIQKTLLNSKDAEGPKIGDREDMDLLVLLNKKRI